MSNKSRRGSETQLQRISKTGDEVPQAGHSPPIIVPLDGSPEAKLVLPIARLVAQIVGAAIHIVHASEKSLSQQELLRHVSLRREETRKMVIDQASGPAAEAGRKLDHCC